MLFDDEPTWFEDYETSLQYSEIQTPRHARTTWDVVSLPTIGPKVKSSLKLRYFFILLILIIFVAILLFWAL